MTAHLNVIEMTGNDAVGHAVMIHKPRALNGGRLGTALLAAGVLAGAVAIGALGQRAITGTGIATVPAQPSNMALGVPFPGGVAGPSQLTTRIEALGVPFPGGVAGPSQLTTRIVALGVPFPGGVAGPSQLWTPRSAQDRFGGK